MYALLRSPGRVPALFSPASDGPALHRRSRGRPRAWRAFDDGQVRGAERPYGRGQRVAAACTLLLLSAVPFLKLADLVLDAAMPR